MSHFEKKRSYLNPSLLVSSAASSLTPRLVHSQALHPLSVNSLSQMMSTLKESSRRSSPDSSTALQVQANKSTIKKTSLPTKLACGAVAGVMGTSIIFPIDSVKTRLQNQTKVPSHQAYTGLVDCMRKVIKSEGVGGLYRGLAPNLIGIIPEKAIKLAVNDYAREYFADRLNASSPTSKKSRITADTLPVKYGMLAGATAGFCQVVATNPMEIVKIRMQLASTSSSTTRVTPLDIVRSLGLKGMYKGTLATLCRDVPFSFIFFPSLSVLKYRMTEMDCKLKGSTLTPTTPTPFWAVFGSGILAGIVAAGAVTPMDVVKTRLQVQPKPGDPVYHGMLHCYRQIIQHEGPRALFKGIVPRMMIVSPLFAITVLVYEFQQRYLSSGGKSFENTMEPSVLATSLKKN